MERSGEGVGRDARRSSLRVFFILPAWLSLLSLWWLGLSPLLCRCFGVQALRSVAIDRAAGSRHQLDRPVRVRAAAEAAMAGAEIHRRRSAAAARAAQPGEHRLEGPVAVLLGQKPDGIDHHALAATDLEPAVRPVREALVRIERRRMHPASYQEQIENGKLYAAASLRWPVATMRSRPAGHGRCKASATGTGASSQVSH